MSSGGISILDHISGYGMPDETDTLTGSYSMRTPLLVLNLENSCHRETSYIMSLNQCGSAIGEWSA